MSQADDFVLATSQSPPQGDTFDVINRSWAIAIDSNNGAYGNGQVLFAPQGITQSQRYVDWKSSFIMIPFVMAAQQSSGGMVWTAAATENNYVMSLKNSCQHLIHALNIQLGGSDTIKRVPFNNLRVNYEMITEAAYNDLYAVDPMFLSKDSSDSCGFDSVIGSNNVAISDVAFAPATGYASSNKGRRDRMIDIAVSSADAVIAPMLNSVTASAFDVSFKSYPKTNTAGLIEFVCTAIIPCRILHSFWGNIPLCKAGLWNITLETALPCSSTVTYSNAGAVTAVSSSTPGTATFPLMLSKASTTAGTGNHVSAYVAGSSITLSAAIAKSAASGSTTAHAASACRLYLSMVTLSAEYETMYLRSPVKAFTYSESIFNQVVTNVASGNPVYQEIAPNISAVRSILICPFISKAANGTINVLPVMSPFASEPGTCSPGCYMLTNFNVILGGQNVLPGNGYNETFLEYMDIRAATSADGGLEMGASTGALSKHDWQGAYGYWYLDLSRNSSAADLVQKNVVISFTNSSAFTCDYYVIINYEMNTKINVVTSQIVI